MDTDVMDTDVTYADLACSSCGYLWRQCEVNKGYAGITSDCPVCHGKAKPGAEIVWGWAPNGVATRTVN